jgi:hypothetical protein
LRRRRVGLRRGEGEERKGEKGRLTGGTQLSVKGKKRKRRGRRRGLARGVANGPLGQKGREASFFLFPNSFQIKLFFSNSNQNSSNLFTKFYKLFRSHTSNKNHAKPNNDAQPLVVSTLIKLSLIF